MATDLEELEDSVDGQRKKLAVVEEMARLKHRVAELEARTSPEALQGSLWAANAAPVVQSRAAELLRTRPMESFADFMAVTQALLVDTHLGLIDTVKAAELRAQLQMIWASIAATDPDIAQRTAENNQSVYMQINHLVEQARKPVAKIEASYTTIISKADKARQNLAKAPSAAEEARAALAEVKVEQGLGVTTPEPQSALVDDDDTGLDL